MRTASQTVSNEKAGTGPLDQVLSKTIETLDASVQQYFTKSDMESFATLYETALKKFTDHENKLFGLDQKEGQAFGEYAAFVLSMSHAMVSTLALNAAIISAQVIFVSQLMVDHHRDLEAILKKADKK